MTIKDLVATSHEMSRSKGWYDGELAHRNIPEMLALLHSEVTEMLEEYRVQEVPLCSLGLRDSKGKPLGFASEAADVAIRLADLCGYLDIDLTAAIVEKQAYNATRSYRHGGKKA
jgi:NTP pyrophosphatase (non-canonical NTP hydrolase)